MIPFIALGDVVILRKLKDSERTTSSGAILLPESAQDMRYVVAHVGPGRRALLDGTLVHMVLEAGQIVLLSQEPAPVQIPGVNLYYCAESDCIAVVGRVEA